MADLQNSSRRKSSTRNITLLKAAFNDIILAFKKEKVDILALLLTYEASWNQNIEGVNEGLYINYLKGGCAHLNAGAAENDLAKHVVWGGRPSKHDKRNLNLGVGGSKSARTEHPDREVILSCPRERVVLCMVNQ